MDVVINCLLAISSTECQGYSIQSILIKLEVQCNVMGTFVVLNLYHMAESIDMEPK